MLVMIIALDMIEIWIVLFYYCLPLQVIFTKLLIEYILW